MLLVWTAACRRAACAVALPVMLAESTPLWRTGARQLSGKLGSKELSSTPARFEPHLSVFSFTRYAEP